MDNTREADETITEQPDDEVAQDEAMDELSSYFSGKTPKILVTTSKKCSPNCYDFCAELVSMFPDSQFAKRGPKHELKDVIKITKEKEFTDLLIVNEDRKVPSKRKKKRKNYTKKKVEIKCISLDAITLIHLPDGPTAYFKLSGFVPSKKIIVRKKIFFFCYDFLNFPLHIRTMVALLHTTQN